MRSNRNSSKGNAQAFPLPVDTVKEILGHTQMDSMKSYMRISREKLAMCSLSLNGIEVRQEDLL